ncbi:methylcytosine dioxygenase TET2 isoform X2 [Trichomycterus rosablanca]|uniref:methylcytosine dioxygenase TET2 isoform X2 n=1 Tax=Trichomycterus rosablanca TaxID=2290929 RepID=UPI002F355F73
METEKPRHETEESLILAQFSTTHRVPTKLQNGNQSPDASTQQLNGDSSWSLFRPTKRHCLSPAATPDQEPYGINGETKHNLYEQSAVANHQAKKFCASSEMDADGGLDKIHELSKSVVNKINCNYPNGDVFSLPRNNQVPMPNGATPATPSVEDPAGDLTDKALPQSQYYPEHATPPPQNRNTSNLHEQVIPSPSSTSGYPVSAQMLGSAPPASLSVDAYGSNGYDPALIVNGHSESFKAELLHQQPPYPHSDLPALVNHSQSEPTSGRVPTRGTGVPSLSQNGPGCFAGKPDDSSETSNQMSYPVPGRGEETGSFSNSAAVTSQQHLQYSLQQRPSDVSCSADNHLQGGVVSTTPPPLQPPAAPKNQCSEPEQNAPDQKGHVAPAATQGGWINLNAAPAAQHHANQPHMWRSYPQNQSTDRQNQGGIHMHSNCNPPEKGQLLNGYSFATPPMQPHHNVDRECRHGRPQTPSDMHVQPQPNIQLNQLQAQEQVHQQIYPPEQQQLRQNNQNQPQRVPPPQSNQQHASTMQHSDKHPQNPQRHPMEGYTQSEMISPTYRPPRPPDPVETGSNPSSTNLPFSDQSRPNSEPLPKDVPPMFSSDAAEMQKQQQRQYSPSPGAQHSQHSQQHIKHFLPNNLNFPHSQPQQLPEGLQCRYTPVQRFPKMESHESCSQFQRGPFPNPGTPGDFQRHAALRMHLLQKQERPPRPQSPSMIRPDMQFIKRENGPRFEAPVQMPAPQMQHQYSGMQATVKREQLFPTCGQSQQRSILATMEQKLQQFQPSTAFERKSLVIKSPNKVKVEMSGGVAVVSTNLERSSEDHRKPPNFTPKKEPGLKSFLESPMKLLNTPIKNLLDTPNKTQYEIPSCHCVEQIIEKDEGPYYTHLGAAPNIKGIRETMETRSGLTGGAIRIEKVVYTGKEGKSTQGCPIAKWVIRRSSVDEKLLVLVRERAGHSCATSCIVVAIMIWDGIQQSLADRLYGELSETLTKNGVLTNRRCALNEERTCACQGLDTDACGASFSFGCSWSMYYNGCKFARSKVPRKFKLLGDDAKEEEKLERNLQELATLIGPEYRRMAPEAYGNQVEYEYRAPDCRLGLKEGRPFSGVTACLDFCAHAHRDLHNMPGGSTVVCTLTREDNRQIGEIPEDEQLHVLPLYKASSTDEFGSAEAQLEKTRTGAIQVLSTFRRQVRMLAEPAKSCRQRKLESKKAANKPQLNTPNAKVDAQAKQQKLSAYSGMGQNHPATGTDPGHQGAPPLAAQNQPQQQHQQSKPSTPLHFPSPSPPTNYPRFPNTPGSFTSTSKPANMFTQPHSSASPYHSPLPVPNPYMNGPNPPSPFPGALPPNNLYPGYQCNEGIPMENYHPYYSNPNNLGMYRQQRPPVYPDQPFGINYPPGYGEPGLPVNGYANPNMHRIGHYHGYTPNGGPNAQFMGAVPRPSSAHPSLDYAAANKCGQFGRYPSSYLAQNPQMQFPQNTDPLGMQIKPEMSLQGSNGFPGMLPPTGVDGMIPGQPPGMNLPNGTMLPLMVKQEPGVVMPAPEPEEEDMWSDNEHNFLDPDIGGVALAPSHGSILIECAKRELHATTPLKKPDRTHPTRISLVFYQHKNLNEAKHGLTLWEAKMAEKAREKEEDAEKHGTDGTPSKGGKRVKKEHLEPSADTSDPPYKRFIQMLAEQSLSCTTNTYVSSAPYAFTKVTGPYSHFS